MNSIINRMTQSRFWNFLKTFKVKVTAGNFLSMIQKMKALKSLLSHKAKYFKIKI
jgi:hypothetical protein